MSWQDAAACATPRGIEVMDGAVDFPSDLAILDEAKNICRYCEVQTECATYAITRKEVFGIWGALAPEERKALQDRSAA